METGATGTATSKDFAQHKNQCPAGRFGPGNVMRQSTCQTVLRRTKPQKSHLPVETLF
ncbi:MAG: hypothetical protein IKQ43_07035 [Treponema sp.]|nr:hypothetical protein [Treponema sp.]